MSSSEKQSKPENKPGEESYLASMIGWAIVMPCAFAALIMLAR